MGCLIWWISFLLWNFPKDFDACCIQIWLIFKMRFLIIGHCACFASFKFRISSIKFCKHLTPAGQCFKISEPSFLSFDNFNVLHILSISKLWSLVNKYYEVNKCLINSIIFCSYSSPPRIHEKKCWANFRFWCFHEIGNTRATKFSVQNAKLLLETTFFIIIFTYLK